MTAPLTRRSALATAAGLGVSVSFLGRAAFAASEGDLAKRKLVVVVCRGGMDGLSVSPPVGDPDYAVLRERIAIAPFGQPGGALKLDDTFGLHPALASVHDLALKGQARICPAVATPHRKLRGSGFTAGYGFAAEAVRPAAVAVVPAIATASNIASANVSATWVRGLRPELVANFTPTEPTRRRR